MLDLSKEEFVLTIVIVIFSPDRRGLLNSNHVTTVQENYATLLERAMISPMTKAKYGRNRFPVSKVQLIKYIEDNTAVLVRAVTS